MKKITLVFPTMYVLWQFRNAIRANHVEINVSRCSLTCNCNEEQLKKAMSEYGAKILETAQGKL